MTPRELIEQGKMALGIEFGSTRIKGVLIDYDGNVLAVGGHEWENQLVDGVWTYDLADADAGLRSCYSSLRRDVEEKYGVTPKTFGAIGVSAMMHGYIALDRDDRQIARFQTWRNTNTTEAADELTELFQFNIPLRWSVAHLYQRLLDGEEHVKNVASVFTLAAYMHYKLTPPACSRSIRIPSTIMRAWYSSLMSCSQRRAAPCICAISSRRSSRPETRQASSPKKARRSWTRAAAFRQGSPYARRKVTQEPV